MQVVDLTTADEVATVVDGGELRLNLAIAARECCKFNLLNLASVHRLAMMLLLCLQLAYGKISLRR